MKSKEDFLIHGIDAEQHVSHMQEAWERAQEASKDRFNPNDFIDLYGAQAVRDDLKTLAEYERDMKVQQSEIREEDKLALIFEAIVAEGISLHDWLGEHTEAFQTSRFDDVVHGVDTVAESVRDGGVSHLGLAMDVTIASELGYKIKEIAAAIRDGELARVKYFQSDEANMRGELRVPKVVVGVDKKTAEDLADVWVTDRKSLAEHPAQIRIIKEILLQLTAFSRYAQSAGKPHIARSYEKAQAVLGRILEEKGVKVNEDELERDVVFIALKRYLETL